MMVVAAGAEERRLVARPLHDVESEHVAVEAERTIDVRNLQVDVPDVDTRINRLAHAAKLKGGSAQRRSRPLSCRYGPQGREPFIAANPSAPSSTRNAFMRPDMPTSFPTSGLPQASREKAPVAICRQEGFRHPLTQGRKPAKIRPADRERISAWTRVNRAATTPITA